MVFERDEIENFALSTMEQQVHSLVMKMSLEQLFFLKYIFRKKRYEKATETEGFVNFVFNCKRLLSNDGANELDKFVVKKVEDYLSVETEKRIREEFAKVLELTSKLNKEGRL